MSSGVDLKKYGLNFNTPKPDYAKQMWSIAMMFFVFGLVILVMLFFLKDRDIDPFRFYMFVAVDMLLFFGFAAHVYLFWKLKTPEVPDDNLEIAFNCKHCNKGFANEKLWKAHERSCVEMKL
ncbi:MAG: C2H2-type zinc finger protein [Thermoplasmata archaeon]|nr:C2H2-type zinc finger protein [Thermoplasmata archaeon]